MLFSCLFVFHKGAHSLKRDTGIQKKTKYNLRIKNTDRILIFSTKDHENPYFSFFLHTKKNSQYFKNCLQVPFWTTKFKRFLKFQLSLFQGVPLISEKAVISKPYHGVKDMHIRYLSCPQEISDQILYCLTCLLSFFYQLDHI